MAGRFEYAQAEEVRDAFAHHGVRYLFLGKNGPFDLDLIFAPDGIEDFAAAWSRRVEVEGFPVCALDDIIASKVATNRVKDRESLPRLLSFRDYWRRHQR